MAIDISYSYNLVKSTCLNYLGRTLKSTFWTAVLIVIIILFIVTFMYPSKSNRSFGKLIKPIIYMFIFTLIILFIHDSCIKDESKILQEDNSTSNIIGGIKLHNEKNNEKSIYEVVYGKNKEEIQRREHEQSGTGESFVKSNNISADAGGGGGSDYNSMHLGPSVADSDRTKEDESSFLSEGRFEKSTAKKSKKFVSTDRSTDRNIESFNNINVVSSDSGSNGKIVSISKEHKL